MTGGGGGRREGRKDREKERRRRKRAASLDGSPLLFNVEELSISQNDVDGNE